MTSHQERAGALLLRAMQAIEQSSALDSVAHRLVNAVRAQMRSEPIRGMLEGRWLGHSFHPLLTDFAEGHWMAANFLDLFGPPESSAAARRLMGAGLVLAAPTYFTGLAEWANARTEEERRLGMVHLTTATFAISLYMGSYLARLRDNGRSATLLGLAGGLVALGDGYIAGHLGHVKGLGVGTTASSVPASPKVGSLDRAIK